MQCEHTVTSGAAVTCLTWGYYGPPGAHKSQIDSKRKRKRSDHINGAEAAGEERDIVLAFGTNKSDIQLFSPAEGKIVKTLRDEAAGDILDFKFINDGKENGAWSVGADGVLRTWDTWKGISLK